MNLDRATFEELDRKDPLAHFRARFLLPDRVIYLDGNSLGALPRSTPQRLAQVIEHEWGGDLITAWNRHGWIASPQRIGDKIARLIGAGPGEVIVAESTSVNLFKVLAVALKMRPDRRVIVTEHPCPVCKKPLEEYSYNKDGQEKSMLRCSDATARAKPKHKDVAYFRGKEGQWWSPKLGNIGANVASRQA